MRLSKKFFDALQGTAKPYHQIAWDAGLKPHQLYRITSGIDRPGHGDDRIRALCQYLGMPLREAFETN